MNITILVAKTDNDFGNQKYLILIAYLYLYTSANTIQHTIQHIKICSKAEFLSLNPVPGLQIQSGEVLHPDVGSISICELSPDLNFSLGKVLTSL